MIRRLVDLVVFWIWDRTAITRPPCISIALRAEKFWLLRFIPCPICRDIWRAAYYRGALPTASPRAWRYLEARRPDIVFLWRFGAPAHPVTENA